MRKKFNFDNSILKILLHISSEFEISNNSLYYLKKITFYVCEYIVNFNSKNKNKKHMLNEKDIYSGIYNLFTPTHAHIIIEYLDNNRNVIKKNLLFSTLYVHDVIKSITKRPFKHEYLLILTYLVEFINHEILEHATFKSRFYSESFITKDVIIRSIKSDLDLIHIINLLNIKLVTENRYHEIISDNMIKDIILQNTKDKKLDNECIKFLVAYIGSKIDNVIDNIKHNTNNKITKTDVENNLHFLL